MSAPPSTGRKRTPIVFVVLAVVMVAAAGAGYVAYSHLVPQNPCCVPEPARGELFLLSYDFRASGGAGSLSADFGLFEGQNVTISGAYLDSVPLTEANSNLTSSCGVRSYGTWEGYRCQLTATFGASEPAPASGSLHTLKVTESTGGAWSFLVTAGLDYNGTGVQANPVVLVSGSVYSGCVGSHPLSVTFTDESGDRYNTSVSYDGMTGWSYSIQLVNGHSYGVSVSYQPVVPNPPTDTTSAGTLALDAGSTTYTYNIPC